MLFYELLPTYQEGMCHEGSKACKAVYCGDTGLVFTTGFSRFSDRQYGVWDEKNLNTPLRLDNIDSSSGVLTPFYDHDTRVVFVAGKVSVSVFTRKKGENDQYAFDDHLHCNLNRGKNK